MDACGRQTHLQAQAGTAQDDQAIHGGHTYAVCRATDQRGTKAQARGAAERPTSSNTTWVVPEREGSPSRRRSRMPARSRRSAAPLPLGGRQRCVGQAHPGPQLITAGQAHQVGQRRPGGQSAGRDTPGSPSASLCAVARHAATQLRAGPHLPHTPAPPTQPQLIPAAPVPIGPTHAPPPQLPPACLWCRRAGGFALTACCQGGPSNPRWHPRPPPAPPRRDRPGRRRRCVGAAARGSRAAQLSC